MPNQSERPPELLRADREQLDRAAELLRGDESALVIVVCAKLLVPLALEHLCKQASVKIPEPMVLQGSDEALDALMAENPEIATAKVRSLALGGDAKEALRALNWHREKLLRGAPVVLWLDGVDGLTEMREAAPDAYSFRDMVVLVRGDGGRLPQVPYKESRSILDTRRRLARAKTALERAGVYRRLSSELRIRGYLVESENVARRGLDALPDDKYKDEAARVARAGLWAQVALAAHQRGSETRQREAAVEGLNEIQGLEATSAQTILPLLLVTVPGPIGNYDRVKASQALLLAQTIRLNSSMRAFVMRANAENAMAIGDVVRASKLLGEADYPGIMPFDASYTKIAWGRVMRGAGRLLDAELYFLQGISMAKGEGVVSAASELMVAGCWMERGELRVAEKIILESSSASDPTYLLRQKLFGSLLALAMGDLPGALERVRACVRGAARLGLDRDHRMACQRLAQIAIEGSYANRLEESMIAKIAIELEVAEEVSRTFTGNEQLSWGTIRFLDLRAAVLDRTNSYSEAFILAQRAFDLARSTCTELMSECGRILAHHFFRIVKYEDALSILAEVEPVAVGFGMLGEVAHIRAARVLALVLSNRPSITIEPAMTALREALESTSAPRIKAEILLNLAIRLPPTTTLPDPLALASETHALFVEMPMPAKEARSLELAGDVLAARGKPAEAKRRYLMAQGILERRGMGLRLPLLATKIEQLS